MKGSTITARMNPRSRRRCRAAARQTRGDAGNLADRVDQSRSTYSWTNGASTKAPDPVDDAGDRGQELDHRRERALEPDRRQLGDNSAMPKATGMPISMRSPRYERAIDRAKAPNRSVTGFPHIGGDNPGPNRSTPATRRRKFTITPLRSTAPRRKKKGESVERRVAPARRVRPRSGANSCQPSRSNSRMHQNAAGSATPPRNRNLTTRGRPTRACRRCFDLLPALFEDATAFSGIGIYPAIPPIFRHSYSPSRRFEDSLARSGCAALCASDKRGAGDRPTVLAGWSVRIR